MIVFRIVIALILYICDFTKNRLPLYFNLMIGYSFNLYLGAKHVFSSNVEMKLLILCLVFKPNIV